MHVKNRFLSVVEATICCRRDNYEDTHGQKIGSPKFATTTCVARSK